jgi:hypothetical protein
MVYFGPYESNPYQNEPSSPIETMNDLVIFAYGGLHQKDLTYGAFEFQNISGHELCACDESHH